MTAKQHASRAVRSFGTAHVVTGGVVGAILLGITFDDGGAGPVSFTNLKQPTTYTELTLGARGNIKK